MMSKNKTDLDFTVNDAVPDPNFLGAPYHAETFSTGASGVCNAIGFNCLTFTSKRGVTLTTPSVAKMIADKWNHG